MKIYIEKLKKNELLKCNRDLFYKSSMIAIIETKKWSR